MAVYAAPARERLVEVPTAILTADGSPLLGYQITNDQIRAGVSDQHPLWPALVDDVLARGYRRVLIPELEEAIGRAVCSQTKGFYQTYYPALRNFPQLVTGTSSIKTLTDSTKEKTKYLDLTSGGFSSSELARAYLTRIRDRALSDFDIDPAKPIPASKHWDDAPPDKQAALFYRGGRISGPLAFIDCKGAYWQLHRHATMDMKYSPNRYVGYGVIRHYDTDAIDAFKSMRLSIHGMTTLAKFRMFCQGYVKGSKAPYYDTIESVSPWQAPDLYRYVMDCMHAIAIEMIDNFDAKMILTDAYIVPASMADNARAFLRERWGMDTHLHGIGPGALYGMNRYQVGNKVAGQTPRNSVEARNWSGRPFDLKRVDNLDRTLDTEWLNRQRQWLVEQSLARTGLADEPPVAPGRVPAEVTFGPGAAEPETAPRPCEFCGRPMPGARKGTRFCSTAHSRAAARR